MGSECLEACIKEEQMHRLHTLPESASSLSRAAFTLKKVRNDPDSNHDRTPGNGPAQQNQTDANCGSDDEKRFARALRRRPWINYGKFDMSSDDESDCEQSYQGRFSKPSLPRGVIRGCSRCDDCQKVIARWRPDDGCRPMLDAAPVFYPNEEEFKDTLKYITGIRAAAEPYGICRIVPPPSWQPPCPLKDKTKWQTAKFPTRVQQVHKLQVREQMKKYRNANGGRRKRRKHSRMERSSGRGHYLSEADSEVSVPDDEARFGFDSGSEFTLEGFQKYANDFKEQYFGFHEIKTDLIGMVSGESKSKWEPSVETVEGEYWRVVEKPTEEIEVLYGADVETGVFGSGFPKSIPGTQSSEADPYIRSGWNLNNFARLPGSVLSYEGGDISGVLVPWLYLGMCFSSFCWHVEDHHFYSLNYMHWGAPKVWYGVPGCAAVQLEQAMRKHLPHLFEEQPDLLHKLVTQLSPSVLNSEGVPVYRCVQNAGEFVLTFPRAYHAGFNCGFNCAEAVNVAPIDWLPHGQSAVELYREQSRKTSVSHDKLLLGASRVAVKSLCEILILGKMNSGNYEWQGFCGQDGLLTKAVKTRVEMERDRRGYLSNPSRERKMDRNFDATNERECFSCYYDLHLSAVGCECCSERFACLQHGKQICACPWNRKFFLYRYDITELDILVEALEGKLDSISRWVTMDLGLALSSHITSPNTQAGVESKAMSLCVNSQKNNKDINVLVGESKTSFTSMLNLACRANVGDLMVSSAMQRQESKLIDHAPTLVVGNDGLQTQISAASPWKDTIMPLALQTSSVTVTVFSAMQQQDSKLPGCVPLLIKENDVSQTTHKCSTSMGSPRKVAIPDMNMPCRIEENYLSKESEVLRAKTMLVSEDFPDEYLSHESSNRQHCSKVSEVGSILNEKVKSASCSQSLQEGAPHFVHSKMTSACQKKFIAGLPAVRTADDQSKLKHESSISVRDSASANDYILLSDDEENTERDIVSATKSEVMLEHWNEGIPVNAHSSGRISISNLPAEKVYQATVHHSSRMIGQKVERMEVSMHGREQLTVMEPENTKVCTMGESHTKHFDFMSGKDFSVGSGWKSNASIHPTFSENVLTQVGSSQTFSATQLQGLLPEGSDMSPGDSIDLRSAGNTAVTVNFHPSKAYTSMATDTLDMNMINGSDFSFNHMSNERKAQSVFVSSSSAGTVNSAKLIQNKGPRIAKVAHVQKSSYDVELIAIGVMCPDKPWHNNQTIFPKGFKSRVKFYSVVDPTQMCYYVSEVLDACHVGPLFKVIMEGCSTEVFIQDSVYKCWELVQERLNQEIMRQRSLGKQNLPALQPPGSLNGLDMFGFTSPLVIKAIEELVRDHKCEEYWCRRPSNASKRQYPETNDICEKHYKTSNFQSGGQSNPAVLKNFLEEIDNRGKSSIVNLQQAESNPLNLTSPEKIYMVLKGFFRKANPDELRTLHKVLSDESLSTNWRAALRALVEELQNM